MLNAQAQVVRVNGVPRLVARGQVVPLFIYRNRLHTDYAYIKRFVQDGHRLIVCSILQNPDEPWGKFRQRTTDHLNRLLDLGDKHYLIFGHYFVVSQQWAAAHPDHICHDEHGRLLVWKSSATVAGMSQEGIRYALSSPLVREQMREYTRRHLEILEDLPRKNRILGMMFEGGGAQEWYVYRQDPRWAFSEAAPIYVREFREFLRQKYGSNSSLRDAWQDKRVKLETATPAASEPAKPQVGDFFEPARHQRFLDTREFYLQFHTAAVLTGPREMKRHRPDLLAGFFNEPIIDDPMSVEGHLAVREEPAVDFFAGPAPYECRAPKDTQPLHTLTGSLRMRGKIFIAEEDQGPPRLAHGNCIGGARDLRDYSAMLLRQGLQDITAGAHAWWWDFQTQWHQSKQEHDTFQTLLGLDRWNLQHRGAPCAQIAVIWDRDSAPYMRSNGRICRNLGHREMIQELDRIGAPWDGYATDDLSDPAFPRSRYKLFVIPYIPAPNSAARRAIDKLKRTGVTLLWGWGAGFCNPDKRASLSVRHMQALTGMSFRVHDQRLCPTVYVADAEHPLTRALPDNYAYGQFTRELRSQIGRPERPLFPPITACAPLFAVDDPDAQVLGYTGAENAPPFFEAGHKKANMAPLAGVELHPGLAMKRFPGWISVYSGTLMLPGRLIREVARLAGVHIYNETEDVFFANTRMLGLMCGYHSGSRTIRLPRRATVLNLLGGKPTVVARRTREFRFEIERYRTAIFGLQ